MVRETKKYHESDISLFADHLVEDQICEFSQTQTGEEKYKLSVPKTVYILLGRYDFRTIITTEEIFFKDYNKGYFLPVGKFVIETELSRFEEDTGILVSDRTLAKIIKEIKLRTLTYRESFAELKFPEWTNLQNAWINIFTKEVFFHNFTEKDFYLSIGEEGEAAIKRSRRLWDSQREFEQTYLFLSYLAVKFDKNMDCPNFHTLLNSYFDDELDILTVWEWIGYCLYNKYPIKKACMFYGPSDSGKSTLVNIVIEWLGHQNVTSTTLFDISRSNFAMSGLYTKKMNVQAELSSKMLKDTSFFKKLTGRDLIRADVKNKDALEFHNTAKIFVTTNKPFQIEDESEEEAFSNRWNFLHFIKIIPFGEQRDEDELIEECTTENEKSGILNNALLGLERLLNNRKFSNHDKTHDLAKNWRKLSKSSAWFWEELVDHGTEEEPGITYSKEEMFGKYLLVCETERIPKDNVRSFVMNGNQWGFKSQRKSIGGVREQFYNNILFNNGISLNLNEPTQEIPVTQEPTNQEDVFERTMKIKARPPLQTLKDIIIKLSRYHEDGDIKITDLTPKFIDLGYTQELFDELMENLSREGDIYEPRPGIVRLSTD